MKASERFPLVIVGTGRLGTALARALLHEKWPLRVLPHSPESERLAHARIAYPEHLEEAALCLLCVPDAQVAPVAQALKTRVGKATALVHCAGALTLHALGTGARRGSFHPLVAVSSGTDSLGGHGVAIAATMRPVRTQLMRLASALKLVPLEVPEPGRAAYHAGAVLSAGGLVSLLSAAVQSLESAGLAQEEALEALIPLMRSALDGVAKRGLVAGLTGPIVRGDIATVEKHLQALPETLVTLYQELGAQALRLKSPSSD